MSTLRILLTGGSGCLGSELRKLIPGIIAPGHQQMDITNAKEVDRQLADYRPQILVHAAAYTDVAGAENENQACWRTNVEGTRNLVKAACEYDIFFFHISTDYVFAGNRGMYREEDALGPVCNYYSLSKLVAEELVKLVPRHVVVRTSFRPRVWPYPVAFSDIYTSQDYVDIIAAEIALAIQHYQEICYPILHIATKRKSVYELAKQRKHDVKTGTKQQAKVVLPDDISLDISRWQQLKTTWRKNGSSSNT